MNMIKDNKVAKLSRLQLILQDKMKMKWLLMIFTAKLTQLIQTYFSMIRKIKIIIVKHQKEVNNNSNQNIKQNLKTSYQNQAIYLLKIIMSS